MFRSDVLKDVLRKAEHPYFSEGECEEIISVRFNTEEAQKYLKRYGFYPYEIWNVDYTFVCFMFLHLKALTEFHKDTGQLGDFPKKIEVLTEKVQELLHTGWDFLKEEDHKKFNDVCKEFVRLLPGMWT